MLKLDAIDSAPVNTHPFPFFAAENTLSPETLDQINFDFPHIAKPGIFPLSELKYGDGFAALIKDVRSPRLQEIIEQKFNLDLSGKPLMITVRGQCQNKDGRIHTDSLDKIVTCLLYLNGTQWNNTGGCLRLLRSGDDLKDSITEIPPVGGNFVAFVRTHNSWHGHKPYSGPRRYIMFNWVTSDTTLAKNIGRHKLSAFFKRRGW